MSLVELLYVLFSNKRFTIGFAIILFELMLAAIGPYIYPVNPFNTDNPPTIPPSEEYPLGTDRFGRDIFAQVVHGIRNSLYVGVLTGIFTISIGLVIGVIAGIKGGLIDEVLMSLTNIILIIPGTLLAILIVTYIGYENAGLELVAGVLSITAWPGFARAVRAQFMSLREREFIYLSKMTGMSTIRIAFQDLLPHIATYTMIMFVNYMNVGINGEVGLSILGLTPMNIMTLGKMLYFAAITQAFIFRQWWVFITPGLFLIALTTSLLLIATGIDEVFNPRLRRM
ncbi:ABC transporter permease [Thermosphaera aggregans]|jgi:peptide/nickel transport system permease protein|uniref:Binding-protein-dependent transport systems inner membrane component n=1 Tax=Thermosphaera aggregans (strain DSM 11486 / M11TL) TaxID=633148 RepID=D5U2N4_THEAM|nr:ABC transporter permease [Thermosphaera aggregans]ADG91384.1 binding-protein-dependent transport systems inner membrane component [Thermosphaera aggregans DSM 11486]